MKINFTLTEDKKLFGKKYTVRARGEFSREERQTFHAMTDEEKKRVVHNFFNTGIKFVYPQSDTVTVKDLFLRGIAIETPYEQSIDESKGLIQDLYRKMKRTYFETSVEI